MMSPVQTKFSGVDEVDLVPGVGHALGQVEGKLVVEAGGPVVESVESGLVGGDGAVHRVALDRAVGEAQGEGGVGIGVLAVDGEAGLADLLAGGLGDAFDVVFLPLAHLADDGIELARQDDEAVGGLGHGRLAAVDQLLAHGRVGQLGAGQQRLGRFFGRFAVQAGLDVWIVGAELLEHLLHGVDGQRLFQARVDGGGGEEAEAQRFELRVVVAVQTLAVGFLISAT